jgi:hypothetical protein
MDNGGNAVAQAPTARTSTARGSRAQVWRLCLLVGLLLLVSGCGGRPTAEPVPDLHLPGVTRLAALSGLLGQQSAERFDAMVPYATATSTSSPHGAAHLLALLGAPLYDVGLDERDGAQPPQLLDGDFPCTAPIAVSQDSAWAACATGTGIGAAAGPAGATRRGGRRRVLQPDLGARRPLPRRALAAEREAARARGLHRARRS